MNLKVSIHTGKIMKVKNIKLNILKDPKKTYLKKQQVDQMGITFFFTVDAWSRPICRRPTGMLQLMKRLAVTDGITLILRI